jgi:adenylate cyclase class IV
MIEIEKKFKLTSDDIQRLTADGTLLGEKQITDTYYDNALFVLGRGDMWLRERNGRFELKMPLGGRTNGSVQTYDELEDDESIRKALNLPFDQPLVDTLTAAGYNPFCICKTTRTKYKIGEFGLDVDVADFGDFTYELAEIELMAEDAAAMAEAERKILEFAKKHGLALGEIRGKIIEYIARKRPEHFEALKKAWNAPNL